MATPSDPPAAPPPPAVPPLDYVARLRGLLEPGRLGRSVSLNLLQALFETGFLTVSTLVVGRIFGDALFGLLGIPMAGVQFLGMALDGFILSLVRSVTGRLSAAREEAAHIGWRAAWVAVLTAAVLGTVLLGLFLLFEGSDWRDWFAIGALAWAVGVTRVGKAALEGAFRALGNFGMPARVGCVLAPLQALAIIAAALAGYRIATYLTLLAAFQGINVVVLAVVYAQRYLVARERTRVSLHGLLRYSVPLMLRGTIGFFYVKVNVLLISWYASFEEAGSFRIAEQFLLIPLLLIGVLINVFSPKFSELWTRGDRAGTIALLYRGYALTLAMLVPLAIAYSVNDPLVRWLFPEGYALAPGMIRAFAPLIPALGISYLASGSLLVQAGEGRVALWLSMLIAASNLTAVFFVVRSHGAFAAVWASVGVQIMTAIIATVTTHWVLRLPFRIAWRG